MFPVLTAAGLVCNKLPLLLNINADPAPEMEILFSTVSVCGDAPPLIVTIAPFETEIEQASMLADEVKFPVKATCLLLFGKPLVQEVPFHVVITAQRWN